MADNLQRAETPHIVFFVLFYGFRPIMLRPNSRHFSKGGLRLADKKKWQQKLGMAKALKHMADTNEQEIEGLILDEIRRSPGQEFEKMVASLQQKAIDERLIREAFWRLVERNRVDFTKDLKLEAA